MNTETTLDANMTMTVMAKTISNEGRAHIIFSVNEIKQDKRLVRQEWPQAITRDVMEKALSPGTLTDLIKSSSFTLSHIAYTYYLMPAATCTRLI